MPEIKPATASQLIFLRYSVKPIFTIPIAPTPAADSIVLGVAAVFEGISLIIPLQNFLKEKGPQHFWHKLRLSKDPSFFVVIFENGAALIGLFIAFCGVFFSNYFHLPVIDGAASILIGLVLGIVAVILIIEGKNLLIGEITYQEDVQEIYAIVQADDDVYNLRRPLTMQMGPGEILLALDVEFKEAATGNEIPKIVKRLEKKIKTQFPDVKQIFIEANTLQKKKKHLKLR